MAFIFKVFELFRCKIFWKKINIFRLIKFLWNANRLFAEIFWQWLTWLDFRTTLTENWHAQKTQNLENQYSSSFGKVFSEERWGGGGFNFLAPLVIQPEVKLWHQTFSVYIATRHKINQKL